MTLEANYVIHKYLLNHLRTELAYVDDRFNHLHGNMIGVYSIFFMCMISYKICTRLCYSSYICSYIANACSLLCYIYQYIYIYQGCLISIEMIALAWFPECQWSNPERYVWHWQVAKSKKKQKKNHDKNPFVCISRADSRFAPSQKETELLCYDVSSWLGACISAGMNNYNLHSAVGCNY